MPTITYLEDCLRDSEQLAQERLSQIIMLRSHLCNALAHPASRDEYRSITLLLDAASEAENIIKVIYFRYHNKPIVPDDISTIRT